MAAKTPPSLPPFADDWVGGDIHGLWSYAATMYAYQPSLDDVVTALDGAVRRTVTDAGWQGAAASAFTTAWDRDAEAGRALSTVIGSVGDIVGDLSYALAVIENAWESGAEKAAAHGVSIGADGVASASPSASSSTGASSSASATAAAQLQQWVTAYDDLRTQCLAEAKAARASAASSLQSVYAGTDPGAGGGGSGGDPTDPGKIYDDLGNDTSALDALRSLLAVPTTVRGVLDARLTAARTSVTEAAAAARENARGADGKFGPWSDEDKALLGDQRAALSAVRAADADAASQEGLLSKILGTGFAGADGAEGGNAVTKLFGDVPVASGALALVGVGLTIDGDRSRGESWGQSVSDGVVSNGAALVAGEAVGGIATGVAEGALGAAGLAAGGAALGGVLVGGAVGAVVAVGVGDLVHNAFQENWGADIQHDGVVGGLLHGAGDTFAHTGEDLANMGKSLWDGVASIF